MKVLILATDIYTRGGMARYTWTLASALGDLVGRDNVHMLTLLGRSSAGAAPKRFRILQVVADQPTAASKFRFAAKALGLGLRKYDLVICVFVGLAPLAGIIRLLFGTPYWVCCHGIEVWNRLPLLERLAVRQANRIVPISRFTAAKVAEMNGVPAKKIRIVYNAIPEEQAAMLGLSSEAGTCVSSNGGQKRLLSVGMLSQALAYKGFDTVIRALPQVLAVMPNVRYTIVGEGDNRENLRLLAAELGVSEHVEFTGEVSDARLALLYRASDIFVLPSRAGRACGHWEGEGFGRVYVEAALAGKPVVGSREGGAAEAVLHGETGLLVDPRSQTEVADALITLLETPKLAARMGREGQRWARKNFTESALQNRLREMLGGAYASPEEMSTLCAEFLD